MKTKLFFISFFFFLANLQLAQCPLGGDSHKLWLQQIDSLKNRSIVPMDSAVVIKLDSIMNTIDDRDVFHEDQYVSVTGYILLVKHGGPETCNCLTQDPSQWDIHIEIVDTLIANPKHSMIVEINRYILADNPDMNYDNIVKLKSKKVTITGFLFFDVEHKQNSFLSNPTGTNIWRGTEVEIHPVLSITEIQ